MINQNTYVGRLTKKPICRTTQGGTSVTSFSLAVDTSKLDNNNKPVAAFVQIVAWGKNAENLCKHADQGDVIGVVGEVRTRSYEKDGVKIPVTETHIDRLKFIRIKAWENGNGNRQQNPSNGNGYQVDEDFPFAVDHDNNYPI